ncbi:MAG TPA: hypothetical protein VGK28_00385 [Candidatus Dormibacteraeota bacterium]
MIEAIAAAVTWLGASLIVLADGRRGLALGVALATLGLSVVVWQDAGPVPALLLAAGGGLAAGGRAVAGPAGWGLMPPGSTPRIVLSVGAGLLALWIALGITSGPGGALRFAVLTLVGMAVARVLSTESAEVQLTAAAVVAIAVAAAAGLDANAPAVWPSAAAAFIAAGTGWLRLGVPRAA